MTGPVQETLPPVLVVSGTGTEVGKTVVTAAIAALAASGGRRVAVVKPVQTGEPPGPAGDLQVIRRLSGVTQTHELARFPDPLSPEPPLQASRVEQANDRIHLATSFRWFMGAPLQADVANSVRR